MGDKNTWQLNFHGDVSNVDIENIVGGSERENIFFWTFGLHIIIITWASLVSLISFFFGYYFVFCAFHASLSASTVYYLRKERNKKIWKSRNNERIFFLEHLDRNDSENALKAGQLTQFYILFLFRSFFSTFLFLMNLQKRIWWYSKGRQRRKKIITNICL